MTQQLIFGRISKQLSELAQEFDLLAKTPVEQRLTLDFDYEQLAKAIHSGTASIAVTPPKPLVGEQHSLDLPDAKPVRETKRTKRATKAEIQSAASNAEAQKFTPEEVQQAVQAVTVSTSWGEPEEADSATPPEGVDGAAVIAAQAAAAVKPTEVTDPLLQQMLNPTAGMTPQAAPLVDPVKAFQQLVTRTNTVVKNNPEAAKVKADLRKTYEEIIVEYSAKKGNTQIKSINHLSPEEQEDVLARCEAVFKQGCEAFGVSYE